MGYARYTGETTLVMPYASIETLPTSSGSSAPSAPGAGPLLLEAKLLWGRDTLAVKHVPSRGLREIRVRDLGLDVAGCDDLLVGSVDEATGSFTLRLPNGAPVPAGCRMTLRMGRALLRLSLVADDVAKLPRARRDPLVAFGILAAAALHLIVLATIAHSRSDEGESEQAARATMLQMVASAEERALSELAAAQQKTRETRAEELAAAAAIASTPAKEEAKAGNPSKAADAAARARITRGDDRHAATTARATTNADRDRRDGDHDREEAASFGILSLLAGDAHAARAGSAAFAPETGRSAMGNIFGQTIDDAAGIGGLGLSGAGEGGGGKGAGVPLGTIGTLGCCGGRAPIMRAHTPGYHWVSDGGLTTQVNGRLMPESVQRVVRQNFGRLRACYAAGLLRDPGLEGRVSVKFVIDREGAVTMAMPWSDTTLPDASVARCVSKAYEAMSFPKPEGGIVTVVYPVMFTRTSP
ncbi:MAG: putative abductin-like protein [Myxococcaceae bacterium]|nr:putative abductin-like protein [Myxococcaceae bacterium]